MTLATHGLDFGYPRHVVGRGLDLALEPGEVLCVLGPNGTGKTTLFRTLLGLLPVLGGRVTLEGRELRSLERAQVARCLAYVPQASAIVFDFTLREVVVMGRAAHLPAYAQPGPRDERIALEALERLGIGELADRSFGAVSGGERQLALLARALASEARCMIMDEPTANLDFGNQALILEEIARLRSAGAGVLFSTHHPDHALRIADRVVMIRGGSVMAAGATAEVVNSENLSGLYGRPVEVALVASPGGAPRRVCVPGSHARP